MLHVQCIVYDVCLHVVFVSVLYTYAASYGCCAKFTKFADCVLESCLFMHFILVYEL